MQKPTLRLTITFTLATMTLLAGCLITWFSYQNSSRTLVESAQKLMTQVSRRVEEKTTGYPAMVLDAVLFLRALGEGGKLWSDNLENIERIYFALIGARPQIASLDFADDQGNYLMVKRMPDGSLASKLMRRDGDRVRSLWKARAPGATVDQLLASDTRENDDYDPRKRPWYLGAMAREDIFLSDVHAYYPNKEPEITASLALVDPAGQRSRVVGASLTLQGLSEFLANIDLGGAARVFVVDVRGRIIAFPGIGDWLRVTDKEILLPEIGQMRIPEMTALAQSEAFRQVRASGQPAETLSFQVGGETWLGNLQALPNRLNEVWFIGTMMAESSLIGPIKQGARETLLLILVTVVLAVALAMLVGRNISRPLLEIARETARIRDLDFSEGPHRDSTFREIAGVFNAYDELRIGLRAFEKYVPTRLVRQLLATRQEVGLGGELRELSLFFSDVRDFSTTAESLPPATLAQWLGDYLGLMAETVDRFGGTVDKFIGDGVMAFWNAPRAEPDHAFHSVLAAFACVEAVSALEDADRLHTRIGIHSGEAVVGNFGSPDRLNYTVVGDGVNLAARLEAVNKLYGTQILITRATWERLGGRIACRHLDRIAVKGKAQATDIYEPLGLADGLPPDRLEGARRYELALDRYLAGDFAEAHAAFDALLRDDPGNRAAGVMVERCASLLRQPPAEDWCGVFELHSK